MMLKKIFLLGLLFLLAPVFINSLTWQEAGCVSSVGCVDADQCACLTTYKLFDENGMETNEFDVNEKIYVAFTLKNVGAFPLENMKLFYITQITSAYANGVYSKSYMTVDGSNLTGIDLDPGKSISYSFGVLKPVEFVNTAPPSTYTLRTYVSSESNNYYQVPSISYVLNNPNENYVGAYLVPRFKREGETSWLSSLAITSGEKFDYRIIITNYNKEKESQINFTLGLTYMESCDTYPDPYVPGVSTTQTYTLEAGGTKTFLFEGCKVKQQYESLGRVHFSTTLKTVDNALLYTINPSVYFQVPLIRYYDIYANKDYLEGGTPITTSVKYVVDNYAAPPGTKVVFTLKDNKNPSIFLTKEIIYEEGLPKSSNSIVDSVTFDYPEGYESDNFSITARVYDAEGNLLKTGWGITYKTYSTSIVDSGNIYSLDESRFIKSSGECELIDVIDNKKRIICNFSTNTKKVLAIISDKYLVSNLDFDNVSFQIIDEYSDGVLIAMWPKSTTESVVINFTISDKIEADDFGIFESLILIILSVMLLHYISKNSIAN